MKKILFSALAALVMLATACEKNPPVEEINSVYFESFGLYAEDNPTKLTEDYVVENLSKTSIIEISLPAVFHPDSLVSLVPNFKFPGDDDTLEDTDDNKVIVTVNETEVIPGETALDFTNPLEFVLQKGTDYFMYTVTVKITPSNWEMVASAAVTDTLYGHVTVAPSEASDEVFLFGVRKKDQSAQNYPVLYSFKNNALSSPIVIAERRANSSGYAVGVNPQGVPYVVFGDYNSSTKSAQRKSSVFKYENGVSSVIDSLARVTYLGETPVIVPFSNNYVTVAGQISNTAFGGTSRALNISEFNGSKWTNLVPINGRDMAMRGYLTYAEVVNGVAYMLVFNNPSDDHSVSVYSNDGSGWKTIGEKIRVYPVNGGDYYTTIYMYHDIAVNSKGEVYILTGAQYINDNYHFALMKVGKNNTLTFEYPVITNFSVTASQRIHPQVTFDANDIPYVVYTANDGSDRTMVTHFDLTTREWTASEPISDMPLEDEPEIVRSKSGNLYVVNTNADKAKYLMIFALKQN